MYAWMDSIAKMYEWLTVEFFRLKEGNNWVFEHPAWQPSPILERGIIPLFGKGWKLKLKNNP